MAISPGSDLVLDVVRAADPAAVREATAMLKTGAPAATVDGAKRAAPNAATFDTVFSAEAQAAAGRRSDEGMGEAGGTGERDALAESYRGFEAMVLRSFIQSMLPADSENVFGEGTAGEIWKGMMAEELGKAVAEAGGIGIAERLLAESASVPADAALERGRLHEWEREALDSLLPGDARDDAAHA